MESKAPFLLSAGIESRKLDPEGYARTIPAVSALAERPLSLDRHVTFLVGENGSGKSTLIEAIAIASRLNPEGGSKLTRFGTRGSHSEVHKALVVERADVGPLNGFFLRAESFFNVATQVEQPGAMRMEAVYERPLHEQSHGESFLALALERFGPRGLYILDEPEAALSLQGQLALMRRMHDLVRAHSQFIVATHSPILLGYPEAVIYELDANGVGVRAYEETEQFRLTRSFLEDRGRFLHYLFEPD